MTAVGSPSLLRPYTGNVESREHSTERTLIYPVQLTKQYPAIGRSLGLDVTILDLTQSWLTSNLPTAQIERVLELATSIFEDPRFANDWLNRPNLATDEKPPVALLGTEEGLARVETLLHRIEYGVLA